MSSAPRTRAAAEGRDTALVLAGGGNRACFQLGVLDAWAAPLEPRLAAVAASSAGAGSLVFAMSGRQGLAHRFWMERCQGVTRNFRIRERLRGGRLTPHAPIFRATVRFALDGGGFERLRSRPFPLYVVCCAPPPGLPRPLSVGLGVAIYVVESSISRHRPRLGLARRMGYAPRVFDARDCRSADELTDLVMASCAAPPFLPVGRFRGRMYLDGGLVDNVPAQVAEYGAGVTRTLVLLNHPHPDSRPEAGPRGGRVYFAPSRPVPAGTWDYTRPERVDAGIRMGRREATRRRALLDALLAMEPGSPRRGASSDLESSVSL